MEPGEYLVTYRAVDKYGNTGVCQIQLLVESPINQVTIRPHVTYSTTIQPYLDQITTTKKISTTTSGRSLTSGPICQNIRPPENGQGSIWFYRMDSDYWFFKEKWSFIFESRPRKFFKSLFQVTRGRNWNFGFIFGFTINFASSYMCWYGVYLISPTNNIKIIFAWV